MFCVSVKAEKFLLAAMLLLSSFVNFSMCAEAVGSASVSTLAGSGVAGFADGIGIASQFSAPSGLDVDRAGNIYIADKENHRIRKIDSAGNVSTLGGSGLPNLSNTLGIATPFMSPQDVAVDSSGNVYVVDQNAPCVRKIDPTGFVSTFSGSCLSGFADGPAATAQFRFLEAIAVDALDNVYVMDQFRVRKIDPSGNVSTLAGDGSWGATDGPSAIARFSGARGLDVDASGNVYVADTYNRKVRKIDPQGNVRTIAGNGVLGSAVGPGHLANLSPNDLAVDNAGYVYVTDNNNQQLRMIDPAGNVSIVAGHSAFHGYVDGVATSAQFSDPAGIAIDGSGSVYLADRWNHRVRKIMQSTVNTPPVNPIDASPPVISLNGGTITLHQGAPFAEPGYLAIDNVDGDISGQVVVNNPVNTTVLGTYHITYDVVDAAGNNAVQVTRIVNVVVDTGMGTVSTLAGNGLLGYLDGVSTAAKFALPSGVAVDGVGNVYVADTSNLRIRKISLNGQVSTLTSSGFTQAGSIDGQGASVWFNFPEDVAVDSAGNIYVADTHNHRIRKIDADGNVVTLAGSGMLGVANGAGGIAKFSFPRGIAVDLSGNVYVGEDSRRIRKIDPLGNVSTLAGSGLLGAADGPGHVAMFSDRVAGIDVDHLGNVYVADSGNNRIRKILPDGTVSTLAGTSFRGYLDGAGLVAKFSYPTDVAVDAAGNLFVTDSSNDRIRKIDAVGNVSTLAGSGPPSSGYIDGAGVSAKFSNPKGVAVDATGRVYVADTMNDRIRKIIQRIPYNSPPVAVDNIPPVITLLGTTPVTLTQGDAYIDAGATAQDNVDGDITGQIVVNNPVDSTVIGSYQVTYNVADVAGNSAVQVVRVVEVVAPVAVIDTTAPVITLVGGNITLNLGEAFVDPGYTAVDDIDGDISSRAIIESYVNRFVPGQYSVTYNVSDAAGNAAIQATRAITVLAPAPSTVSTFAGSGVAGLVNGSASLAQLHRPAGVAVDSSGNVYVADRWNNRIRKIQPDGTVSVLAGSGAVGLVDGVGHMARFNFPSDIAVDAAGNVYVVDRQNHCIRKILPNGVVTTLAGSGVAGFADGVGRAAQFHYPDGIAVDAAGNLYVSDTLNGRIRKILPDGTVTTLAGYGVWGYADGAGSTALFDYLTGIAVDDFGNVYVADKGNHLIRKILPDGSVSTLAGTGLAGFSDGDALTAAQFDTPYDVDVDNKGNVIVSDLGNQRVRKIAPDGMVTTLAGNGLVGSADGAAAASSFNGLQGVAVDASGAVYVGDTLNHSIRKIIQPISVVPVARLGLNSLAFRAGDRLTLLGATAGSNPAVNADIYYALLMPGGTLLVMQPDGSFATTRTPFQANVVVSDATSQLFSYRLTGLEPAGAYTWYAALMEPGTMNVIGAVATVPFIVTP